MRYNMYSILIHALHLTTEQWYMYIVHVVYLHNQIMCKYLHVHYYLHVHVHYFKATACLDYNSYYIQPDPFPLITKYWLSTCMRSEHISQKADSSMQLDHVRRCAGYFEYVYWVCKIKNIIHWCLGMLMECLLECLCYYVHDVAAFFSSIAELKQKLGMCV